MSPEELKRLNHSQWLTHPYSQELIKQTSTSLDEGYKHLVNLCINPLTKEQDLRVCAAHLKAKQDLLEKLNKGVL